ncbi:uncharacterized protein V1518DRAFT_422052 [Limtongia smithiae]|uniref:uncharacterized protein n=1 Tax=Limtongia smithiae TaxID=1125753 RepID=UPI0034CE14C7
MFAVRHGNPVAVAALCAPMRATTAQIESCLSSSGALTTSQRHSREFHATTHQAVAASWMGRGNAKNRDSGSPQQQSNITSRDWDQNPRRSAPNSGDSKPSWQEKLERKKISRQERLRDQMNSPWKERVYRTGTEQLRTSSISGNDQRPRNGSRQSAPGSAQRSGPRRYDRTDDARGRSDYGDRKSAPNFVRADRFNKHDSADKYMPQNYRTFTGTGGPDLEDHSSNATPEYTRPPSQHWTTPYEVPELLKLSGMWPTEENVNTKKEPFNFQSFQYKKYKERKLREQQRLERKLINEELQSPKRMNVADVVTTPEGQSFSVNSSQFHQELARKKGRKLFGKNAHVRRDMEKLNRVLPNGQLSFEVFLVEHTTRILRSKVRPFPYFSNIPTNPEKQPLAYITKVLGWPVHIQHEWITKQQVPFQFETRMTPLFLSEWGFPAENFDKIVGHGHNTKTADTTAALRVLSRIYKEVVIVRAESIEEMLPGGKYGMPVTDTDPIELKNCNLEGSTPAYLFRMAPEDVLLKFYFAIENEMMRLSEMGDMEKVALWGDYRVKYMPNVKNILQIRRRDFPEQFPDELVLLDHVEYLNKWREDNADKIAEDREKARREAKQLKLKREKLAAEQARREADELKARDEIVWEIMEGLEDEDEEEVKGIIEDNSF